MLGNRSKRPYSKESSIRLPTTISFSIKIASCFHRSFHTPCLFYSSRILSSSSCPILGPEYCKLRVRLRHRRDGVYVTFGLGSKRMGPPLNILRDLPSYLPRLCVLQQTSALGRYRLRSMDGNKCLYHYDCSRHESWHRKTKRGLCPETLR